MTTEIKTLRAQLKTLREEMNESAEAALLALRTIARIFAPVVQTSTFLDLLRGANQPVIAALIDGADPTLFVYRFDEREITWLLPIRHDFSLSADVRITIRAGERFGHRDDVEVTVSWASGGGSVSEALAQASLYLDLTQKAAQAETILRSMLRSLDRNPGTAERTFKYLAALSRVSMHLVAETRREGK